MTIKSDQAKQKRALTQQASRAAEQRTVKNNYDLYRIFYLAEKRNRGLGVEDVHRLRPHKAS
jgi:hypothetical protein